MIQDPEILALSKVFEAMRDLDNGQRKRIIEWSTDKFGITEVREASTAAEASTPQTAPVPQVQAPQAQEAPEIPAAVSPFAPPFPISPAVKFESPAPKEPDIRDFKTVSEFLANVTVKKNVERVLLCAAYQQLKKKVNELSAREINMLVKDSGTNVSSITASLNALLNKKPPMLELTKQSGKSKRYRVTPEGLNRAKNYLKK